jgi:CheY-like chemotaxis protein
MTVLLVEDEPWVRLSISEDLIDAGYDVINAANSEEAIVILERRTRPTSAVLSDARYFAKRVTLNLALRSSGDAGRGFRRVGAAAALVAG